MANINRKIERQKSNNSFTKNTENKEPTKLDFIKANFSFNWVKLSIKTIIFMVLDFLVASLLFIPLLARYYPISVSFVLVHTFITSLLVVTTFIVIEPKNRPKPLAILLRYIFTAILLFAVSIISVNFIG